MSLCVSPSLWSIYSSFHLENIFSWMHYWDLLQSLRFRDLPLSGILNALKETIAQYNPLFLPRVTIMSNYFLPLLFVMLMCTLTLFYNTLYTWEPFYLCCAQVFIPYFLNLGLQLLPPCQLPSTDHNVFFFFSLELTIFFNSMCQLYNVQPFRTRIRTTSQNNSLTSCTGDLIFHLTSPKHTIIMEIFEFLCMPSNTRITFFFCVWRK